MKKTANGSFLLSLIILILMWGFAIVHFKDLPKTIPTHFGINGRADGFGRREMIFTLPGVATLVSILLYSVSKFPRSPLLNVPNNLRKNPEALQLFISILHFLVLILFADLLYETILVATGKLTELTAFSTIWDVLLLIFTLVFNILYRLIRK